MDRQGQIRQVISKVVGKAVDVDVDASLFESGILDSFALVSLVNGIEKEFAIRISDSDLIPQRFDSISRIERYLTGILNH